MPRYAPFRRLRRGDLVAVVAPASRPEPDRLDSGLRVLRDWGLVPVLLPGVGSEHPTLPHLAGPDEQRAADLVSAWRDPRVRAMWCARGGYGTQRALQRLPAGLFGEGEPKPVIGFSDVTPLLHAALSGSGTQMVHGPAVTGLGGADRGALAHLRDLLFERHLPRTLVTGLVAWTGSDVRGTLLGGNAALLAASVGTGDLPNADGAVVLLEDVGQQHWVLDRGLTQLIRSGWLDGAAGILLGDFTMADAQRLADAVLWEQLSALGVPVWGGLRAGHGPVNLALPIGATVRLGSGYLRLE